MDETTVIALADAAATAVAAVPGKDSLYIVMAAVAALAAAGFGSLVLRQLRIPYALGLLALGLTCAWAAQRWDLAAVARLSLTRDLAMHVLLPALVFDAALAVDVRGLFKSLSPALLLSVPGVAVTTVIVGVLVHYLTPLSWGAAMAFGALISATDPAACVDALRARKAPERLTAAAGGESLLNTGAAVAALAVVGTLIAAGGPVDLASAQTAAIRFVWLFFVGIGIGICGGILGAILVRISKVGRGFLGVTFSLCAAYGSFFVAEIALGASGVVAALGAGVVISGFAGRGDGVCAERLRGFWSFAGFVCSGLVFLLAALGEKYLLDPEALRSSASMMLAAAVAVLLARAVMVYGLTPFANMFSFSRGRIRRGAKAVLVWGGLRGALPVALAAGLDAGFLGITDAEVAAEERRLVLLLTLGVVLFTLLVQGVSLGWLLRRLRLANADAVAPEATAVTMTDVAQPVAGMLETTAPEEALTEGDATALAEEAIADQMPTPEPEPNAPEEGDKMEGDKQQE